MSEQNIKTKRCFDADIDEALRIIWINRKKEKAIKNMNSMQRKLHQRQFAVIHFLFGRGNGMKNKEVVLSKMTWKNGA